MEKVRFALSFFALVLAASLALSCGANQNQSQNQLRTIMVSPATADAQNYPDGQVPFIATGIYVNPTRKVTPQPASWNACQQNAPATEVSVSNTGVAQCEGGASGTYTIDAFDPTNCTTITACGGGCTVLGTAQLTCP